MMHKGRRIQLGLLAFVLFFIIIINPSRLAADAALKSSFQYVPQNSSLAIDQTVTLQVSLQWSGSEDQYRFAVPSISAKNFELLRIGQTIKREDGFFRKEFEYEFKPLKTGSAEIPAFQIPYTCDPNCDSGTITVASKTFQITAPRKSRALWLISLIIFAVCAPVAFFVWKRLNRSAPNASNPINADSDPKAVWMQKLAEIESADQTHREKIAALSRLLTRYSKEKQISNADRGFSALLSSLEQMKFSGSNLSESDLKNTVNRVKSFIESNQVTMPS